jgi:hypothetical protein
MSQSGLTVFRQRDGNEFLALHLLPWDTDAILLELVPKEMQKELSVGTSMVMVLYAADILFQKLESALLDRERNVNSQLLYDPNDSRLYIGAIRHLLTNNSQNADTPPAAGHLGF